MSERNYWVRNAQRRISRRTLLSASGKAGVGAAGLALVGCGDDDDDDDGAVAQVADEAQADAQAEQAAEQADQVEEQAEQAEEQAVEAEEEPAAVAQVRTGEVRFPMVGNMSGLEGVTGTGGGDHRMLWSAHDNLVGYDSELTPTPARSLAETWEIPDPLEVIFNLRSGVKYHDLTDLTGDTVRLHIERAKTLDGSNVKADISGVETVVPVDDQTAVFEMNAPFSPLLRVLGDRAGMLTAPSAFDRINEVNSREAPVGTGAFMYVDEDLDGDYVQEPFPEYWQEGAPLVERLTLTQAVDGSQGVNGLLAGQFDYMNGPPTEDLDRLREAGKEVRIRATNANSFFYINPNLPPWDNIHVRQAVNHAIDRDLLVDVIYDGLHTPNKWGWLGPATGEFFDEDEVLVTYDPARVREELELAGLPDGFEYDMNINNAAVAIAQAEFIQASLAEFNIKMNIVVRPSPDYYVEWTQELTAVMMAGMSVRADVWQQMAFVARENGPFDFALPKADKDAELQAAYTKVTGIFDSAERVEAMRDLNRILESRAYHIKLYFGANVMANEPGLQFEQFADGKEHFGQKDVSWAT
jgi:ABC-type transport system substrate-binding protein